MALAGALLIILGATAFSYTFSGVVSAAPTSDSRGVIAAAAPAIFWTIAIALAGLVFLPAAVMLIFASFSVAIDTRDPFRALSNAFSIVRRKDTLPYIFQFGVLLAWSTLLVYGARIISFTVATLLAAPAIDVVAQVLFGIPIAAMVILTSQIVWRALQQRSENAANSPLPATRLSDVLLPYAVVCFTAVLAFHPHWGTVYSSERIALNTNFRQSAATATFSSLQECTRTASQSRNASHGLPMDYKSVCVPRNGFEIGW